jgi:hypothetical protein
MQEDQRRAVSLLAVGNGRAAGLYPVYGSER